MLSFSTMVNGAQSCVVPSTEGHMIQIVLQYTATRTFYHARSDQHDGTLVLVRARTTLKCKVGYICRLFGIIVTWLLKEAVLQKRRHKFAQTAGRFYQNDVPLQRYSLLFSFVSFASCSHLSSTCTNVPHE
jgi:hypothetical protein